MKQKSISQQRRREFMVRKKEKINKEAQRQNSADEGISPVDAIDSINEEIGFLTEVAKLLQRASLDHEACGNISVSHITKDMLNRLERVKKLSNQLFDSLGGQT
jgi:hypothetical protein